MEKWKLNAGRQLVIAVLLTFAFAMLPSAVAGDVQGSDEDSIRDVLKKLEVANNSGDAEKWVSLFASDFVYMAPGLPAVTHRQELMDVARAGFRNQASVRIEPVEIRVCGDWAFARANVTGSVKLHTTGEVIAVDVKELIVLARSGDGAWQIARLMNNANK